MVDPDVLNTASSPSKNVHMNMQVGPSIRKRLALELENTEKGNEVNPAPLGVLVLRASPAVRPPRASK